MKKTAEAKRRKNGGRVPLPSATTSEAVFRKELAKAEPVISATSASGIAAQKLALSRVLDAPAAWLEHIIFDHSSKPVVLTGRIPTFGAVPDEYALKTFGTTKLDEFVDMITVSSRDGWFYLTFPTSARHVHMIELEVRGIPPGTAFFWGCRAVAAGATAWQSIDGNRQDEGSFAHVRPDGRVVTFIIGRGLLVDGRAELLFWPNKVTADWYLLRCSIQTA